MAVKPWKRVEPTTITKVGWRTIVTKTFELPDGSVQTFDTVHKEGQEFASVIALTKTKQVILASQFRVGPEKIMHELPAGFVDSGETPEQGARRELLEESGYEAGSLEYLGYINKDAYLNGKWHGFIAYDCKLVTGQVGVAEEDIEIKLVSIDEFIKIAKNNGMTDPAFALMAYEKLMELKGE